MTGRILVSREAGLSEEQIDRIREAADGAVLEECDLASVRELAPQSEILAGVDFGIPREIFRAPGSLRWVHLFHAGVEKILCPELAASGVILTCGKGAHAVPIAEHVFAFMLAHVKELARYRESQVRGIWDRRPMGELDGKTVCVVGLGNIGREVARRAECFGMRVVGTRRSAGPVPHVETVVPPDQLTEILPLADFVVLTLPITAETEGLFGARDLAAMKHGAMLINVCRGQVVDQGALIDALKSGHLGGAGLDATDPEPLPADSELWRLPNVIITPHNSGMTAGVRERGVEMFCRNLRRFREGEPLHQQVDKKAGY